MEIIIKFIFGASVFAFVINFLAIIGYLAFKVKSVIYRKYGVNILRGFYYLDDTLSYSDYIFTGMGVTGGILFLLGLLYFTWSIGSFIYSFI